jgi:subtilisin family serine protease
VSDVWLAFAADRKKPQRVLVAPSQGISAVVVGSALHEAITQYRASADAGHKRLEKPSVSPLENFVAVTLYFEELLRIVLPLTTWWHRKSLYALQRKAVRAGRMLDEMLELAILNKLGRDNTPVGALSIREDEAAFPDRRVIEAAPLAALIGVFVAADRDPRFLYGLKNADPRKPGGEKRFTTWVEQKAEQIARAAREELSRQYGFDPLRGPLEKHLRTQSPAPQSREPNEPPELIQRVFLNRKAGLADTDAVCTIKADAAKLVFDISCRNITWAVIDSGIATKHPAFLDHDSKDRYGQPSDPLPSRVRATFDFTRIERIRNFDLIAYPNGSEGRAEAIADVVDELEKLPGRTPDPEFREEATRNLTLIAQQLDKQLPPDWNLIEPLIRLPGDDGARLVSDHGTHVAGILGGDWRIKRSGGDGKLEPLLRGVCPDINLYDLRVIHEEDRESTEFALLASLEFVQFLNARSAGSGPVVHGVNVSLSIPHDVRNYGCGATPVCVACNRLSNSGVVVVAAAGNRGWNEQELGFGNFVFCSITDPGNAQEVITVGSTHRLKPHMFGVSYFSSRGPTGDGRVKPDLVAPGEQIRGPIRGEADDELDGTSMAAPFVSGAAAMLIARHRELIGNPARVKQILCNTATDLGREKYFQGHGLVDVLRALQSV